MKKSIILLLIMASGFQPAFSQISNDKIEAFRTSVLPQYKVYFSSADLSSGGQLTLIAAENYISLSKDGRTTVMDKIVKSWQESLVIVAYSTIRELWGHNDANGRAVLIDIWDRDQKPVAGKVPATQSNVSRHPFFMYGGFQEQIDSHKNINFGFNARTGFFMLRDRWDLAASFSGFMMGNLDSENPTTQLSLGLSSKVYFPIKAYRISPNIGGELAWTSFNFEEDATSSVSPYLLGGISWYVGNGSFDVGVRSGKQTMVLIGYTFIPRLNSAR